jgi:microcystin-dependent protein
MSDISVFGQESYFNENVTFFKSVKGQDLFVENINISSNVSITSDGNITTPSLYVNNNATIAGILTIGTNSVTINGITNNISGVSSVTDEIGGYLTNPPGTLIFHCGSSAPPGYLKANGANISRSAYSALFNALGTTFGAGNGSTTFTLPDMRGEFPRGWDDGRGADSGRAFGTTQAEMINQHKHWVSGAAFDDGNMSTSGSSNTQDYGLAADAGSYSVDDPNKIFGRFTRNDPGFGSNNETRPRNIALLACIKY